MNPWDVPTGSPLTPEQQKMAALKLALLQQQGGGAPMPVNDQMAAGPAPPDPMGMALEEAKKKAAIAQALSGGANPAMQQAGPMGAQGGAPEATLIQRLLLKMGIGR